MKRINLRYEPCQYPTDCGMRGTIRTVPENYYVAHIIHDEHFSIAFSNIEANTRGLKYKIAAIKFWDWTLGTEVKQ